MTKKIVAPNLEDSRCSRCRLPLRKGILTEANLAWALRHGVYCAPCLAERKAAMTAKKALLTRKRRAARLGR